MIGIDVLSYFDPDHGFLGFGDMLFGGTAAVALIVSYPLLRGRNWARILLVVILCCSAIGVVTAGSNFFLVYCHTIGFT